MSKERKARKSDKEARSNQKTLTPDAKPKVGSMEEWFAAMDECPLTPDAFPPGWRKQPRTPKRKVF